MSYETRDNAGSLFRNENKKSDNHPDYSGTCMVAGVEHFFDGWIKTSASGKKWMSFSFKAKEKQQAAPRPKDERYRAGAPDDIPF